jgi:hypothetical protein
MTEKENPPVSPFVKGGFYEEKIIHPHPDPLPSRERKIKVKDPCRQIAASALRPPRNDNFFTGFGNQVSGFRILIGISF